jgi:hypothetical protein
MTTKTVEMKADIPERVKVLLEKLIPDDGSMGREILANFWIDGHTSALESVFDLIRAGENLVDRLSAYESDPDAAWMDKAAIDIWNKYLANFKAVNGDRSGHEL